MARPLVSWLVLIGLAGFGCCIGPASGHLRQHHSHFSDGDGGGGPLTTHVKAKRNNNHNYGNNNNNIRNFNNNKDGRSLGYNSQPRELLITGLFPLTPRNSDASRLGRGVLPAALLARDHINYRHNLLKDYQLQLDVNDTAKPCVGNDHVGIVI
ncbi:hypothetical protein BV898_10076 [Hypsibius exemplaris]|uniref:Uncharacterized protein n=1 Tax=Hypsibius exemplaris TaxID=2072580 RepID=A0A1W0WKT7_HYPEX|nr:hypothetical protein BV898_10076 [Hypsibius exemplaris]